MAKPKKQEKAKAAPAVVVQMTASQAANERLAALAKAYPAGIPDHIIVSWANEYFPSEFVRALVVDAARTAEASCR